MISFTRRFSLKGVGLSSWRKGEIAHALEKAKQPPASRRGYYDY